MKEKISHTEWENKVAMKQIQKTYLMLLAHQMRSLTSSLTMQKKCKSSINYKLLLKVIYSDGTDDNEEDEEEAEFVNDETTEALKKLSHIELANKSANGRHMSFNIGQKYAKLHNNTVAVGGYPLTIHKVSKAKNLGSECLCLQTTKAKHITASTPKKTTIILSICQKLQIFAI